MKNRTEKLIMFSVHAFLVVGVVGFALGLHRNLDLLILSMVSAFAYYVYFWIFGKKDRSSLLFFGLFPEELSAPMAKYQMLKWYIVAVTFILIIVILLLHK